MTLKRKRIGIIILCALFVLMGLGAFIVPLVKITSVALSGNGTEDSPYLITNADDLKVFRDSVNGGNAYVGKHVQLAADIDLKYTTFVPIGVSSTTPFKGIFDGANHTVRGLYVAQANVVGTANHSGFFGYISKATVKNLILEDVSVSTYSATGKAGTVKPSNANGGNGGSASSVVSGGIAGRAMASSVSNCQVRGLIYAWGGTGGAGGEAGVPSRGAGKTGGTGGNGGNGYAGGIVGISDGTNITDCSFVGSVYAWGGAGGNGGPGSNAKSAGVGGQGGVGGRGGDAKCGGITSVLYNNPDNPDSTEAGTITGCYTNAYIRVGASNGGFGGTGRSAYSTYRGGHGGKGGTRGNVYGGGIVGDTRGTVTDCFAIGEMEVRGSVKGTPGNGGYGSNSSGSGKYFGTTGVETMGNPYTAAGGIAGLVYDSITIKNVYSDINIVESHYYSTFTQFNTRLSGIAGVIEFDSEIVNAVSLGTDYEAEETAVGNAFSPIATFKDATVAAATQGASDNLRYPSELNYTNHNPSDIVACDVNAMGDRCAPITAADNLTLGGVFNGFDTNKWEIQEGVNGNRPVLKALPFKEIPKLVYEINTRDELIDLARRVNSGEPIYDLTININSDIELGEWTPMGVGVIKTPAHMVINGNNHVLSNMQVTKTTDYKGFIGYALNVVVSDLTIEDPYITGNGGNYVGGVVGNVNWSGKFNNCHVTQSNKPSAQNAVIRGKSYVGGIVGQLVGFGRSGEIINCSNTVKIHCVTAANTNTSLYVGGIGGKIYWTNVEQCYSTADVVCDAYNTTWTYYAGALVGSLSFSSNVKNCFATGNVTTGNEGAFIAYVDHTSRNSSIENCYYTGNVTYNFNNNSILNGATMRAGGLISRLQAINTTLKNNVILTAKHTFASNMKNTGYRRFGNLYSAIEPYTYNGYTSTSTPVMLVAGGTGRYAYIRNNTKANNNFYNSKVSWGLGCVTKSGSIVSHSYFIDTSAQRASVDYYAMTSETKQAWWRDTANYDYENVWEWNEDIGLPTLKANKYSVPGMAGSAIEIENEDEFISFRNSVNAGNNFAGKTLRLVADLDLSGMTWAPIGKSSTVYFAGTFDGNGHKISNMYVNYAAANKGLFGAAIGATIENLTMVNPVIASTAFNNTGAVLGWSQSCIVKNCHVVGGSIVSSASNVGGVIGYAGKTGVVIENCSSTFDPAADINTNLKLSLTGKLYVGGIVGNVASTAAGGAVITKCYSTRNVNSTTHYVGGIAGITAGANISECYSTGSAVTTAGHSAAGIVGRLNTYAATVDNCFSTGDIQSYSSTKDVSSYSGGIVGIVGVTGCRITNCYVAGKVLSTSNIATSHSGAGGIAALANVKTTNIGGCAVLSGKVAAASIVKDSSHFVYASAMANGYTTGYPTALAGKSNFYSNDTVIGFRRNSSSYAAAHIYHGTIMPADKFTQTETYQDSVYGLGWDFDNVWARQDGVNGGLPYLKALGVPVHDLGSRFNPVQINTKDDLAAVSENVKNGHCYNGLYLEQTADIDFAGMGPIGYDVSHCFAGSYNGLDHKLTGVNITATKGLTAPFGYVKYAEFKNISVIKPQVKQTGTANGNAGGLVGYSLTHLNMDRCAVIGGSITNQGTQIGGLIGCANIGHNTITNSFATAKITAGKYAGGLVGLFRSGEIKKCYARADVTATLSNGYGAGGLVGVGEYITRVYDSYAMGNISDKSTSTWAIAGGVVGVFYQNSNYVHRSYFVGTLSATTTLSTSSSTTAHVAGIVGYSNAASCTNQVKDCVSLATSITATATRSTNYCQAAQIVSGAQSTSYMITAANRTGNYALSTVTGKANKQNSNKGTRVQANVQLESAEEFKANCTVLLPSWNINGGSVWAHSAEINDGLPTLRGLPADNSDLDSLINTARSYNAEDWSVATYSVLMAAADAAEAAAETMTDEEKVAHMKAINDAIIGLRPETGELQRLYDDIVTNKLPYKEWFVNFATMDSSLTLAKTVLEEDSNKYMNKDVMLAYSTLLMADTNLVVNKFKLNETIIKANNVVESDYKPEDWQGLQKEKMYAVSVNNNANATAREVAEAWAALEAVIAGLKIDKSKLEARIKEAYEALGGTVEFVDEKVVLNSEGKLSDDKFESVANFNQVFASAVAAYEDEMALGTTVAQMVYDLGVALNNLTIDKSALKDEYNKASLLQAGQYTASTWAAFEAAYSEAGRVLNEPAAKPNQFIAYSNMVDVALENLVAAVNGLMIDKQQLIELIKVAEEELLNEDIYDPSSLEQLREALAVAIEVRDDDSATAAAISAAATNLNDAILNLRINIEFLKNKIAEAQVYLKEESAKYYTQQSISDLETAKTAAQLCVDDCEGLDTDNVDSQLLQRVKQVTRDLQSALDNILANLDLLKEYISIVSDESREDYIGNVGYAEESVLSIQALGVAAQKMIDDNGGAPSNADVIKGIKDFEYAIANMKADKTALAERVREVGAWTNAKHRQDNDGNWIMDENTGELKVFVVYSTVTWDLMQAALAEARDVVNDANATVEQVKNAGEKLEQGIENLRIDTEELAMRIEKAEGILAKTDLYTAESLAALQLKYNDAVIVYNNIEQNLVRETIDHVQEVLDTLVKYIDSVVIDPAMIREYIAISRAQAENQAYYTELSYKALVTQTDMVEELINDKIIEQDVYDFIDIIVNAMNGLEIVTAQLEQAIYTANGLDSQYITAATYQPVLDAKVAGDAWLSGYASGAIPTENYEDKFNAVEDYKVKVKALNDAIDGILPDVDNYRAFINSKKPVLDGAYSSEGLENLSTAIANAEKALGTEAEEEFSYYVAIENVEAILAAIEALTPDTTALQEFIEQKTAEMHTLHTEPEVDEEGNEGEADPEYIGVEMLTYEYYTPASYDELLKAMTAAQLIVDNSRDFTIEEVDNALIVMQTAYANLVLDKSMLQELIDECKTLNKEYYVAASYAALEAQIVESQAYCDGDDNVIANYVAEYFALDNIKSHLQFDTSALEVLKARAEELLAAAGKADGEDGKRYFTDGSVETLRAMLQEANEFSPDGGSEEGDDTAVDQAYRMICVALSNAIDGLVDLGALRDKLTEAKEYNNDDGKFNAETFAALQSAIADAEAVYASVNSTKIDVGDAIAALEAACRELKLDGASLQDLIAEAKAIVTQSDEGERVFAIPGLTELIVQIAIAEDFVASGSVDKEEFDRVKDALSQAMYAIVELTELIEKINAANKFVADNPNTDGKWTEISYQTLLDAIKTAESARDDDNVTAEQVAEQVAAMTDIERYLTLSGISGGDAFKLIDGNKIYKFVDADGNEVEEHSAENPAYLVNLALGDSLADILTQFENTDVKAFKADGETEITDFAATNVATGIILRTYKNGEVSDQITLVVKGDINGDGKVNAVDKAQLNAYFVGTKLLEGAYKLACDINGDAKINAIDKAQLNAYFVGTKDIYAGLSVKGEQNV